MLLLSRVQQDLGWFCFKGLHLLGCPFLTIVSPKGMAGQNPVSFTHHHQLLLGVNLSRSWMQMQLHQQLWGVIGFRDILTCLRRLAKLEALVDGQTARL